MSFVRSIVFLIGLLLTLSAHAEKLSEADYQYGGPAPTRIVLYDGQSKELSPRRCVTLERSWFHKKELCTAAVMITADPIQKKLVESGGEQEELQEVFQKKIIFVLAGMIFMFLSVCFFLIRCFFTLTTNAFAFVAFAFAGVAFCVTFAAFVTLGVTFAAFVTLAATAFAFVAFAFADSSFARTPTALKGRKVFLWSSFIHELLMVLVWFLITH
ncbi:MAG: hypothetical protein RI935_49 [Candidatus Parcubacteria bacterium]|jgi:hypothetical protein